MAWQGKGAWSEWDSGQNWGSGGSWAGQEDPASKRQRPGPYSQDQGAGWSQGGGYGPSTGAGCQAQSWAPPSAAAGGWGHSSGSSSMASGCSSSCSGGCAGCGCAAGCGTGCGCGYGSWGAWPSAVPDWNLAMWGAAAVPAAVGTSSPGSPTQAKDSEERMFGRIRDYNESGGFGFIECDEAKIRFGMDVFIHRRQMHNLQKGDEVSFVVIRNSNGQPQARQVCRAEDTAKLLAKQAEREKLQEQQLRAKKSMAPEIVLDRAAAGGKVMSEEEARRFQESLKSRSR